MEALADADLVLIVLDASQPLTADDAGVAIASGTAIGDCGGEQS